MSTITTIASITYFSTPAALELTSWSRALLKPNAVATAAIAVRIASTLMLSPVATATTAKARALTRVAIAAMVVLVDFLGSIRVIYISGGK